MGRKQVAISGELFTEMITEGWQAGGETEAIRCIEGLPPGATFVRSYIEPCWNTIEPKQFIAYLVYEHPDWPEQPGGFLLTEQCVIFQRVEVNAPRAGG